MLALKMNFVRTLMWRTLLLIFGMPSTLVEPNPPRHGTEWSRGDIRDVDVISLYIYICKYGKFPVGNPKLCVGADCPSGSLESKGIIKLRFYFPGISH